MRYARYAPGGEKDTLFTRFIDADDVQAPMRHAPRGVGNGRIASLLTWYCMLNDSMGQPPLSHVANTSVTLVAFVYGTIWSSAGAIGTVEWVLQNKG